MDEVTTREERASMGEMKASKRKWIFQETLKREYQDALKRLVNDHWDKHKKDKVDPQVIQFIEKEFGVQFKGAIEDTFFADSVVSIGLFHEEVMVYACSGTSVQYRIKNIHAPHAVFVTSKYLAHKFDSNRTKDDKLMIRVRLPDNTTITGFLGLYNDHIAIVVSFALPGVYPVNLRGGQDLRNLFAYGRTHTGRLMGVGCYVLDSAEDIVSCNCGITEAGLGGPVISFDKDRTGQFAGVMIEMDATFVPTKLLKEQLQLFDQAMTETTHFHGYSLPKGLHSVIPSGFLSTSLMLESLGYPQPPPLVVELNGSLVGRFEEFFGEPHDSLYNIYRNDREKPVWEQLGKDVVQNLRRSVVLLSSFKDGVRRFACTGLLITNGFCKFVLTSGSLFRTLGADGKIDLSLEIEVFLSRNQCVQGRLDMYHEHYNIAIVSLMADLTDVSAQNIFTAPKPCKSKMVVAIARPTKDREGLLLAALGNLKPRRNKDQCSKFDCKDLKLSTCKIKKVGIGGPLIRLEDGSFVGMNFYDESGPTPYLPRSIIVKYLKIGIRLQSKCNIPLPIILDYYTDGNTETKSRWPVSEPYWYLPGNRHPLDLLVGKVLM